MTLKVFTSSVQKGFRGQKRLEGLVDYLDRKGALRALPFDRGTAFEKGNEIVE
jgi:hypothetical protein